MNETQNDPSMALLEIKNRTIPYLSEPLYGPFLRTYFILNSYEYMCVCSCVCVYVEVPMEARISWSYRWS